MHVLYDKGCIELSGPKRHMVRESDYTKRR